MQLRSLVRKLTEEVDHREKELKVWKLVLTVLAFMLTASQYNIRKRNIKL